MLWFLSNVDVTTICIITFGIPGSLGSSGSGKGGRLWDGQFSGSHGLDYSISLPRKLCIPCVKGSQFSRPFYVPFNSSQLPFFRSKHRGGEGGKVSFSFFIDASMVMARTESRVKFFTSFTTFSRLIIMGMGITPPRYYRVTFSSIPIFERNG